MAKIAEKRLSQFERIKQNIQDSAAYFRNAFETYNNCRRFLFESNLTTQDRVDLKEMEMPEVEFNVLEAYISRLCGEFAIQTPSMTVQTSPDATHPVDPRMVEIITGHMRAITESPFVTAMQPKVYKSMLSGGMDVVKVYRDYASARSFNQNIKIERVFDPTMTGFDPLARLSHKSDGNYCYELFPIYKEEFEEQYPEIDLGNASFTRTAEGFNWYYENGRRKIVLLADYYEKRKKKKTTVFLATGESMFQEEYNQLLDSYRQSGSLEQPPAIVQKRTSYVTTIDRYKLIGDQILEYTDTEDDLLPLVFFDGNSELLKKEGKDGEMRQFVRPYFYHAMDAQRMKNFTGAKIMTAIESMIMSKYMADKNSIPEQYLDSWINPQKVSTLIYQSRDKDGNELPTPMPIQHAPIPSEIFQIYTISEQTIQNILGSYDASLGINNNQLSGKAIIEGATQSNAAAKPFMINYMDGFSQVAQLILHAIPKCYVNPRKIPIIGRDGKRNEVMVQGLVYDPDSLELVVKAGVNFEIQKQRNLQSYISLMGVSEVFKMFMEQKGLGMLIKNLPLEGGGEELLPMVEDFQQQLQKQQAMAQQQQQQMGNLNPLMLKQQELQLKGQEIQQTGQYKQAETALKQEALANERMKMVIDAHLDQQGDTVQLVKADTERAVKAAELAMQHHDMSHRHAKEVVELHHTINSTRGDKNNDNS